MIGPNTEGLISAVLASRPHPEQGFRSRLARPYRGLDVARLEAGSARAVELSVLNGKGVAVLLARKPDDAASKDNRPTTLFDRANPRGQATTIERNFMLAHPTIDQLNALGLCGLAKGFKELEHKPEARVLCHAEWLGLLLEYELTLRRQKQFETGGRAAKLRHPASVEDINYHGPRGLDRALFLKLTACDWIAERCNLLVTGASGLGKSWLACGSATRRVEKTYPFSTPAFPGCSPTWLSRTATRATPDCCDLSPASSC